MVSKDFARGQTIAVALLKFLLDGNDGVPAEAHEAMLVDVDSVLRGRYGEETLDGFADHVSYTVLQSKDDLEFTVPGSAKLRLVVDKGPAA